jgi:Zn-finger nucleic acid-binding protein
MNQLKQKELDLNVFQENNERFNKFIDEVKRYQQQKQYQQQQQQHSSSSFSTSMQNSSSSNQKTNSFKQQPKSVAKPR